MLPSTGEEITYVAVQKKPAVTLFPSSIALTNKRVFVCKSTKLGLATDFEIVPWQAIENLSFTEGILGAQVTFTKYGGESLTVAYIPKSQARKLYQAGMETLNTPSTIDEIDGAGTHILLDAADPVAELNIKLKK